MLLTNFNLRKIEAFIRYKIKSDVYESAGKHFEQPRSHPQLKNRDCKPTREAQQPEIAPEKPQERFLFVSTGPFRDLFR